MVVKEAKEGWTTETADAVVGDLEARAAVGELMGAGALFGAVEEAGLGGGGAELDADGLGLGEVAAPGEVFRGVSAGLGGEIGGEVLDEEGCVGEGEGLVGGEVGLHAGECIGDLHVGGEGDRVGGAGGHPCDEDGGGGAFEDEAVAVAFFAEGEPAEGLGTLA